MHDVICGCLCRRRAVPVMDANFSKPTLAFILFFYLLFLLPTSTFTEMRRLARDETPFPLAMQPKVTALAW
jgi:hypothetical protein